ncbi:MAG: DUF1015 domain-containing protein [Coriobacteriales bacterium]
MPQVKPFGALRPTFEAAPVVAALPYDVQDVDESRVIVAANPQSFLAIDEPVVNFPEGTDQYSPEVYAKAGELMDALRASDLTVTDEVPSFYLYELTMDGRVLNGLVACVSVDDYINGIVKKHENTRAAKEEDRVNHVRACKAQTGPIMLAYRYDAELADIYARAKEGSPLFDYVADDGVRHRGFAIPGDSTDAVTARMAEVGEAYVADGHHRSAAATRIALERREQRGSQEPTEESDFFLSVLFADTELDVLPYYRFVNDPGDLTVDALVDELISRFGAEEVDAANIGGKPFSVTNAPDPAFAADYLKPRKRGEFIVLAGGRWYRCNLTDEDAGNPADNLDVSKLQRDLLTPVFGIDDPRRSSRIEFIGGIRGLVELERRCADGKGVAIAPYPTGIDELFAVADANLLMPPKSTWFEPKLRSGLFIHEI